MEHGAIETNGNSSVLIPSWLGWVLELHKSTQRPKGGRLNPFLVRVGVGTPSEKSKAEIRKVLIPSWLGWVLELAIHNRPKGRLGLNPFLVRVGVGTNDLKEVGMYRES